MGLSAGDHGAEQPGTIGRQRTVDVAPDLTGLRGSLNLANLPPVVEGSLHATNERNQVLSIELTTFRQEFGSPDAKPQDTVCVPVGNFRFLEVTPQLGGRDVADGGNMRVGRAGWRGLDQRAQRVSVPCVPENRGKCVPLPVQDLKNLSELVLDHQEPLVRDSWVDNLLEPVFVYPVNRISNGPQKALTGREALSHALLCPAGIRVSEEAANVT
jgi:hypothetical protein